MAITYDNPEVNAMGVSPIDRSRMNGEIEPRNTLAQKVQTERLQQLQKQPSYFNPNMKFADSSAYGSETVNPERALNKSKYDSEINWNIDPLGSNDIGDKRAEAQGAWGRLKDATMNNVTILGTSLASDVVSLTGGLMSAAIHGDISKIWDNDVNNALNDYQRRKLNERQIYRGQDYENKSFMDKLGSGIFWAELWQNAGYMEGMLIPGMAVGKLAQATKLLAKAPQLTKVGTNLIAAIGEASMESLNQKKDSEKDLYAKADRTFREKLANAQNWSEKSALYDEYGKDLNLIQDDIVKIGNRTFGGNVALLTATGTIEFGDFVSRGYAESHKLLKQIARDVSGNAIGRSTFNAAMRGLGKTTINFGTEGFEEFSQRSLASGAANTKKANSFLSKYQDEYNVELADNYLSAVWQGLKSDFFNEEAWLEFMSGALMGGIGIPGSHNGAIANIRDNVRETRKEQELADKINLFESENNWRDQSKQNKFAESYIDYLIRNAGINAVQNQALIDRDKKAFVDSRVEKVLNAAYLYDNIGEIDEFKKKIEWYSHIDNEEELQNLIKHTQEVKTDDNGQVISEEKPSPFKDMSLEEVNKLLKETSDFYSGIIDDFIEGKRFIDDYSRGKLDDDTLKRGAAAYAQTKNFKKRAEELYKGVNENINKYRSSVISEDDTTEDGKFINGLFNSIKDLTTEDIIPTFSNVKIQSSIYALGEYFKRNSYRIDSDVVNNVIQPLVDLANISYDYVNADREVKSILKNAEKERSVTQKLLGKIKNIKKNYLIKKHAKLLSNITDKTQLEERIKSLPDEIRDDVVEYLKNNASEATRNIFKEMSDWQDAYNAILKTVYSLDKEKYPVLREEIDKQYTSEVVDDLLNDLLDVSKNASSLSEVFEKINEKIAIQDNDINGLANSEEKQEKVLYNMNYNNLWNYIKKKIKSFMATENDVRKNNKKNEEKPDESEDEINNEEVDNNENEDESENENKSELDIDNIEPPFEGLDFIMGFIKQEKDKNGVNIKLPQKIKKLEKILKYLNDNLEIENDKRDPFVKGFTNDQINVIIKWLEDIINKLKGNVSTNDESQDTNEQPVDSNTESDSAEASSNEDSNNSAEELNGDNSESNENSKQFLIRDLIENYIKSIENRFEFDEDKHIYKFDGEIIQRSITQYFSEEDIDPAYRFTRSIGNTVHNFISSYFTEGKGVLNNNYLNLNYARKNELYDSCVEIEKKLKKKHGNDCLVIAKDFPIVAKIKKDNKFIDLAGKMDLIVVDKSGNVFIYDIKTNANNFSTISDKSYYENQLNGYRQIFGMLLPQTNVKVGGLIWMKQQYRKPTDKLSYEILRFNGNDSGVDVEDKSRNKKYRLRDDKNWKTPRFENIYEIEQDDVFDDVMPYSNDNGSVSFESDNQASTTSLSHTTNFGVSRYDHEETKKGNKKEYWNDERKQKYPIGYKIYSFLNVCGAYDFVDNGYLNEYREFCLRKNKKLEDTTRYIKTKIGGDDVYLLAIETTNNEFFKNKDYGKKIVFVEESKQREFQIIGMMSYDATKSEYSKMAKLINDQVGEVAEGEFRLTNYNFAIRKINGGRHVYEKDKSTEIGVENLLKDIPFSDFEIGVYKSNGVIKIDNSVASKAPNFRYPADNGTNRSSGSCYIFVKCANGLYYPRQVRIKKLIDTELDSLDDNDYFVVNIKKLIKKICFAENESDKNSAKGSLARYISFSSGNVKRNGTIVEEGRFDISDLIRYENGKYINGEKSDYVYVHKVNKDTGEGIFNIKKLKESKSEDEIVDLIFKEIIRSDKDIKLTPMINIGGKNSNYSLLKEAFKNSSIITSNLSMRSVDCNFELCNTDSEGNIIEGVENIDEYKGTKKPVTTDKYFSFVKPAIKPIYNHYKDLFSDFVDDGNIDSLYCELDESTNELVWFINDEEIDKNGNEKLYSVLNFITDSIKTAQDLQSNDPRLRDFALYDEQNGILFTLSKNSSKSFNLKFGKEAKKIVEEKNIKTLEEFRKGNVSKLDSVKDNLHDDSVPAEPVNDTHSSNTPKSTGKKAAKILGDITTEDKAENCTNGNTKSTDIGDSDSDSIPTSV